MCNAGETPISVVTSQGHFNQTGTQGMAHYRLCCPDVWNIGYGDATFSYTPSGGHVANPGVLSVNVSLGNAGSIQPSCAADQACVFKVSTQGHVASCNTSNIPMVNAFPNRLCLSPLEICDDNVDNTGNDLIDCADPGCHITSSNWFDPPECTNNNQTTADCIEGIDGDGNPIYSDHCMHVDPLTGELIPYYCSYGDGDDGSMTGGRGFCCPAGERAVQDAFTGVWECREFTQCGVLPFHDCKVDFADSPLSWIESAYSPLNTDDWCVSQIPYLYHPESSVDMSTGCCYIQKYGGVGYYWDSQNVKIFGYE